MGPDWSESDSKVYPLKGDSQVSLSRQSCRFKRVAEGFLARQENCIANEQQYRETYIAWDLLD